MKVKKVLIEGKLDKTNSDKTGYQDLTARWFEIKNSPAGEMSETEKRKEYDNLYDTATNIVFDKVRTVKGYDTIKNYMRSAWLKIGFEAGDGTNNNLNLASNFIRFSSNSNISKNLDRMIDYSINMDSNVLNILEQNQKLVYTMASHPEWFDYSDDDIDAAVKTIDKVLNSSKGNKKDIWKTILQELYKDNKLIDLRTLNKRLSDRLNLNISDSKKGDNIKVTRLNKNSSEQDIIDNLNKSGFDFSNEENINKLTKIAQEARKNL